MNKYVAIAWLILHSSMSAYTQHGMISRDQFSQNIQQSFKTPGSFSWIGAGTTTSIDNLYQLPQPEYKAFLIPENTKDTFFFYSYPYKNYDNVTNRLFRIGDQMEELLYESSLPMSDGSKQYFLVYFMPSTIELDFIAGINDNLIKLFKFQRVALKVQKVTLEEIRQEEEVHEPPPPPPKPPKKKKPA